MAKTLQDHIRETQTWIDTPAVGDDFAINIREECLVESHIIDVVEDGVVLAADEGMMAILEGYGMLDDADMSSSLRRGIKSLGRGARGWGGREDSPRELVKRNREHPDQTVLDLRKGIDSPGKGSPQELQRRVLDREIKKRWKMGEQGMAEEQLDELSPKTLDSYATKAGLSNAAKRAGMAIAQQKHDDSIIAKHIKPRPKFSDEQERKMQRRGEFVGKAINRLRSGVREGDMTEGFDETDTVFLTPATGHPLSHLRYKTFKDASPSDHKRAIQYHLKDADRATPRKAAFHNMRAKMHQDWTSGKRGMAEGFSDSRLVNLPGGDRNRPVSGETPDTPEEKKKRYDDWIKSGQRKRDKPQDKKQGVAEGTYHVSAFKINAYESMSDFRKWMRSPKKNERGMTRHIVDIYENICVNDNLLTESSQTFIKRRQEARVFSDKFKQFDERDRVKIKLGNTIALLSTTVIPDDKSSRIELSGFTTPKKIVKINLDNEGKIDSIKFDDGSTFPEAAEFTTVGGVNITNTIFFPDKASASKAHTAIWMYISDLEGKGWKLEHYMSEGVAESDSALSRILELSGMPPAAMPAVTEVAVPNSIDDLYYEFKETHQVPWDIDDDDYLEMVTKFLQNKNVNPDQIEDMAELFLDQREHDEDNDHDYANRLDDEQYGDDDEDYLNFMRRGNDQYDDTAPMEEAKYQGREVPLGKPFLTPDGPKKRSVYVKNPKGNVVKVNFGDKKLRIKKSNPKRRKSFRARHNCANPGPRHKARYWSCRAW